MPEHYEYKSCPDSIKDVDVKKGIVTGYWSSFNIEDSGRDMVIPGAFQKTIREWGPQGKRRTKHLLFHDPTLMLSVPQVLKEDSFGLYFESKVSQTSYGKDALVLYEDGVITEHSIGYKTLQSKPVDGVRQLLEVKLYEGSALAWGMNEYTPFLGMKGELTVDQMADQMQKLENVLRNGDLSSDELCHAIEIRLKQWQQMFAEQKAETKHEREVITITLKHAGLTAFEQKVSNFAQTLDGVLELRELNQMKWRLDDALDTAVNNILTDGNLSIDQKTGLVATSIDQYKTFMLSWTSRVLALANQSTETAGEILDARLSLKEIRTLLTHQPDNSTGEHKDEDEPGDHSLEVNINKLKQEIKSYKEGQI